MAELYSKYDNLKNNAKAFFTNLFIKLKTLYLFILDNINNHKGIYILLASIVIYLISGDYVFPFIWATVLYLLTLAYDYINYKKEKEMIELVEFDQFKELDKVLDKYIEECYNRDVGFFNPTAVSDYLSEKEQIRLMKELKDSVASNMSEVFKNKLELYYGKDRVPNILSTKCFIFITLMAAGNNKAIYSNPNIKIDKK